MKGLQSTEWTFSVEAELDRLSLRSLCFHAFVLLHQKVFVIEAFMDLGFSEGTSRMTMNKHMS